MSRAPVLGGFHAAARYTGHLLGGEGVKSIFVKMGSMASVFEDGKAPLGNRSGGCILGNIQRMTRAQMEGLCLEEG